MILRRGSVRVAITTNVFNYRSFTALCVCAKEKLNGF